MIPISKMAAAVQPSATMAAGAKARQLKAEGKTVYDFSLGEPDFPTPPHICAAAHQAMLQGHTHYTAPSGIVELRTAVVSLLCEDGADRQRRAGHHLQRGQAFDPQRPGRHGRARR